MLKWFREWLGWDYPPIRMYPDEVRDTVRHYERTHRGISADDSECSHAREMFFLRAYTGSPEYYDVDTSAGRLSRCALLRRYKGRRERIENLDIRPSATARHK